MGKFRMAIMNRLEGLKAARTPKGKSLPKRIARKVPMPRRTHRIAPVSNHKRARLRQERKVLSPDGLSLKEQWFQDRRMEMTGMCACGCNESSQKFDEKHFRSSAAHIFPKHLFKSIRWHPLNWVERRMWAGNRGTSACHSIMDETSMERWPKMADWPEIKVKFHVLSPLLTAKEKATNFFTLLEKLVNEN